MTVHTGASITIKVTVDLNEGGWGYLDDITLTRADNSNTDAYMTKTFYLNIQETEFRQFSSGRTVMEIYWQEKMKIWQRSRVHLIIAWKNSRKNGWYQIELKYKKME